MFDTDWSSTTKPSCFVMQQIHKRPNAKAKQTPIPFNNEDDHYAAFIERQKIQIRIWKLLKVLHFMCRTNCSSPM